MASNKSEIMEESRMTATNGKQPEACTITSDDTKAAYTLADTLSCGYVLDDVKRIAAFLAAARPANQSSEQPSELTVKQVEDVHRIIERHSTDVVDYEGATDDINAYLFGGIEQPESRAHRSLQGSQEAQGEWTQREEEVIAELMQKQGLSRHAVLRQGLRLFQMHVEGALKLPPLRSEEPEEQEALDPMSGDYMQADLSQETPHSSGAPEQPSYEQKYNRVMSLLRNTKMEHGLCEPRERKACTNCNAVEELDKLIAEYKGPRVIAQ